MVVGLVASTADERQDDPTVRKCAEIAKRDGYSELVMMNQFASWPTPNHIKEALELRLVAPIGPDNDEHIREQAANVRELGGRSLLAGATTGGVVTLTSLRYSAATSGASERQMRDSQGTRR